jgi:hypothetical protein
MLTGKLDPLQKKPLKTTAATVGTMVASIRQILQCVAHGTARSHA